MDYFTRLKRQIALVLGLGILIVSTLGVLIFYSLRSLDIAGSYASLLAIAAVLILSVIGGRALASFVLEPLRVVWKSIVLLSNKADNEPPPQAEQLKIGRELVANLLSQLYQLISSAGPSSEENSSDRRSKVIQSANIVSHMPLPLFVFNQELQVTNASDASLEYCSLESSQLFGKALNESLRLEFPSERTLETWIEDCKQNKVTDTTYWERVRVVLPTEEPTYRRCDMAAYYNKNNPSGAEFIVTMFDRTEQYQQDDNSMSFVALAVHELRTPLTMLRGYIEVFVDELGDSLDDEMKDFLKKMDLSARQLNAFVGNILNVARVDENALTLHLSEDDWPATLKEIVEQLQPKAKIHGKLLELHVSGEIPPVGIDRISMTEVVSNLIDNAIKYSGHEAEIVIETHFGKDGLVETTVQDHGVGIPEGVVPHIFEKFYRNHRTKAQIGGSGLGLYLAKALVNAHGGQIWVSSKPNEGSTFGFSIQPYETIQNAQKQSGEDELTRTAHGWIKNHSLYRR